MFFWFYKYILMGPLLSLLGRPKVQGLEYVPDSGAVILASNHLAVADSFYLPLVVETSHHLPGQGRVLHRHRPQGQADQVLLLLDRPGADRPHRRGLRAAPR